MWKKYHRLIDIKFTEFVAYGKDCYKQNKIPFANEAVKDLFSHPYSQVDTAILIIQYPTCLKTFSYIHDSTFKYKNIRLTVYACNLLESKCKFRIVTTL